MKIPFQYNPLGNDASQDEPSGAILGVRGVFTYLDNGKCNQSAMSMSGKVLASNSVRRMIVSNSGVARNVRQYSSTSVSVMSGGSLTGLEIMSYGGASIFGNVESVNIESRGSMYLNDGAVATSVSIDDREGYLHVSSGAQATGVSVASSAYCYVYGGAFLSNANFSNGARVTLSAGCSVKGVVDNGSFDVSSGVNMEDVTINDGGYVNVQENGNVSGISVVSGGNLNVQNNGIASNVSFANGGKLSMAIGETDSVTKVDGVNANGSFLVESGVASNVILHSGNITDYASCVGCEVMSGGRVSFNNGAKGYDVTMANDNCYVYVLARAVVSSMNVKGNYACLLHVASRGSVFDAVVSSGANMIAYDKGYAENVTVERYGSFFVSNAGTANSVDVSGVMYLSQFGSGDNINVDSIGSLYLGKYGVALNASLSSGAYFYQDSMASCNSLYCDGGSLFIYGEVDTITYGPHGAYMTFGANSSKSNCSWGANVTIHTSSRFSFSNCTLGDGGLLSMYIYGTVADFNFNGAQLSLNERGICSNISFTDNAVVSIGYYGNVSNMTIGSNCSAVFADYCSVGNVTIGNGADVTLRGRGSGDVTIGSNASINCYNCSNYSLSVADGATLILSSMAIPQSWDVGNLASLVWSNYGTYDWQGSVVSNYLEFGSYMLCLSNVSVTDGGKVVCGGYASNSIRNLDMDGGTVIIGGSSEMAIISGNISSGAVVSLQSNYASLVSGVIFEGGAVSLVGSYCRINSACLDGGSVLLGGYMNSVVNMTVNQGGMIDVNSYARLFNLTLNSADLELGAGDTSCYVTNIVINDGGRFLMNEVYNSATYVHVKSGGSLHVGSNCTASSVTSETGAIITVDEGGVISYS
jgi:hypothetical protein